MNQKLIDEYYAAEKEVERLGALLKDEFIGYKDFLAVGDIEGAKEFLRKMPASSQKVLFFYEIIQLEDSL